MEYELPEEQIPIFNYHFSEGNRITEPLLILKGVPTTKIGFWQKWKARKAVNHYQKCLILIPNHWQTIWLLGKLYQVLNDHEKALRLFEEALKIDNSNLNVIREASIAAMDAGYPDLALKYSYLAVEEYPTDPELICHYAINLMILENDKDAINWIQKALELDPTDSITRNAAILIKEVANGKRKRPKFNELG